MPAVNNLKVRNIKTRTTYALVGGDFSQQE